MAGRIHLINGEYCFDESPPPSPTPVVPEHVGAQELVASQDPPNLTVPLNSESYSNTEPYSARTETAHESVLPKNWERELNSRMNVLSDEQKLLIKLVEEGRNCFVTGSAGTGKSFTMETVIDFIRSKGRSVVVTAPTGVAALQVKGQTLNSFFSLGMSPHCIPNVMHMVKRSEEIKWRLKSVDILVIDEISMVSHSVLDLIHKMLCIARESSEPFGGIQMIVSGDFFQLSSVPDGLKCPHCRSEIRGRKISSNLAICQNADCTATSKPFEFDHRTLMAFESDIWKAADFAFVELTKVFRQSDKSFTDMLERIRRGICTEEDRAMLNAQIVDVGGEEDLYLMTRRDKVAERNLMFYEKLHTKQFYYFATSHKTENIPRSAYNNIMNKIPVPSELGLRAGAKVMLTVNLSVQEGLVNGSRGVVLGFDVVPDIAGEKSRFSKSSSKKLFPVVEFDVDGATVTRVIGMFKFTCKFTENEMWRNQVPLILGWAITTHKSQGMTLDSVTVDMRDAFADGQVYVALSRVKSLKGLSILTSIGGDAIPPTCIKVNSSVSKFYQEQKRSSQVCEGRQIFSENDWEDEALWSEACQIASEYDDTMLSEVDNCLLDSPSETYGIESETFGEKRKFGDIHTLSNKSRRL